MPRTRAGRRPRWDLLPSQLLRSSEALGRRAVRALAYADPPETDEFVTRSDGLLVVLVSSGRYPPDQGSIQYLEARYRGHARVEDRIRTGKAGFGRFPSRVFAINQAWLQLALTAIDLIAWTQLLLLDGALAAAEPKKLRYRLDQRNQLQSSSDGTTYSYTARGTLALTGGTGGVYATTADTFGQVITQQGAAGTSTNAYDATGRAVRPGFKYSGLDNTLAQDSSATYTRGPAGDVIGTGTGSGANSYYGGPTNTTTSSASSRRPARV